MSSPPPTGTITFLFTDIEGSTRLRQVQPEAYERSLAQHNVLLQQAIDANAGHVFKVIGDAFCAAFGTASSGLQAALGAQQALQAAEWGDAPMRVRMALHSGAADYHDGDYWGFTLARVARLLPAGHGGQVLVSQAAAELVQDELPAGASLLDLGERRLRDLVRPEHIYQLMATGMPEAFPPLRTLDAHPHNLPVQLTSFVGREKEIAEVKRLLSAARLLTLVGPGGTGKTRLAVQVAADTLEAYPHGAWLVDLAPLAEPALVPQAVAGALGLREDPNRSLVKLLEDYLRGKQALLLLDNCEHLLDACARLAGALLRAAPGLRFLATSREGLGIAGETTYRVPSLSAPDVGHLPSVEVLTQYDAVQLFIARAVAAQPGFQVTNANAPAVAQICHRLDGIPLALELAAARLRALTPEHIAARLDDRFRLLTGGSRTALERHQTLRAALDWSYELLSEGERQLLHRLSVFSGEWSLEAAEQVCAGDGLEAWDVVNLLDALVNKSLVSREDDTGRYRMLETIRHYASDKLRAVEADARSVRDRHLNYYSALADEAGPHMFQADQLLWLAQLEAEHDNLRAALEHALAAHPSAAVHVAARLWGYWSLHDHWSEGIEWLRRCLAATEGEAPGRWHARAALGLSVLLVSKEGVQEARLWSQRAQAWARDVDDAWSGAVALVSLSDLSPRQAQRAEEAEAGYNEALRVFRELGDLWGQGYTATHLAQLALTRGEPAAALALGEQALGLHRRVGERAGLIGALDVLGMLARFAGDYQRAFDLQQQALTLARELGRQSEVGWVMSELGLLAKFQADYTEAQARFHESLGLARDVGDGHQMHWCLWQLAEIASVQGRPAEADAHLAEAATIAAAHDHPLLRFNSCLGEGLAAYCQGTLTQAVDRLGQGLSLAREYGNRNQLGNVCHRLGRALYRLGQQEQAAALLEEGLAASRGVHALAFAQLLGARGRLALTRGDADQAGQDHRESLALCRRMGARHDVAEVLEGLAAVAAAQAQPDHAARLLGAAEALREQIGTPLPAVEQPDCQHTLALARDQLGEEALNTAWAEGRAMDWEQAAAYALEGWREP